MALWPPGVIIKFAHTALVTYFNPFQAERIEENFRCHNPLREVMNLKSDLPFIYKRSYNHTIAKINSIIMY